MNEQGTPRRWLDRGAERIVALWPLWVFVAGTIVTCVNFYNSVRDLASDQKNWKALSEQRRQENFLKEEEVKIRLAKLETDNDWLKWLVRGDIEHGQHKNVAH